MSIFSKLNDNETFDQGINPDPAIYRKMQSFKPDGFFICAELDDTEDPDYGVYGQWVEGMTPSQSKLNGVLFEGVMCSATAEDQHGLNDIEAIVLSGVDINFHFQNGSTLVLTAPNWWDFRATWVDFRMSFFPLPN